MVQVTRSKWRHSWSANFNCNGASLDKPRKLSDYRYRNVFHLPGKPVTPASNSPSSHHACGCGFEVRSIPAMLRGGSQLCHLPGDMVPTVRISTFPLTITPSPTSHTQTPQRLALLFSCTFRHCNAIKHVSDSVALLVWAVARLLYGRGV